MTAQSWDRASEEFDPWAEVEPRPYRDGCPSCIARVCMPWCGTVRGDSVVLAYQCVCGHGWWTGWQHDEGRPVPELLLDTSGLPFTTVRLIFDLVTRRIRPLVCVCGLSVPDTEGAE